MPDARHSSHQPFPATNWSLVAAAGQSGQASGEEALENVMRLYWPVLLRYLESRFALPRAVAEDFLQDFVLHKILRQGVIERARAERGRFRIFLINSLNHFVISEFRRNAARKRSPDNGALAESLEDDAKSDVTSALAAAPEAKSEFDRHFAWAAFYETVRRMQAECEQSARPDIWGVFQARYVLPLRDDTEPVSYEALVKQFGFASNVQASGVLTTGKRMFSRIFRRVVADYTPDGADIEEETALIKEVLALG